MNKLTSLFLKNSYYDAKEQFEKSLKNDLESWDIVVLTASNENQANSYIWQINRRKKEGLLPKHTEFLVIPDYNNERIGSGGATLNVLLELRKMWDLSDKKVLIIHSGGDSKRVPQYSFFGKLFSPIPRTLNQHKASTLFDELMIIMSDVPKRMNSGIFILCGDAFVLFNPLQLDLQYKDACTISMKMPKEMGTHHGVFVTDDENNLLEFLHKKPLSILEKKAVENDSVNFDTGMVYFSYNVVKDLLDLSLPKKNRDLLISKDACLNLYGDFLYPLAKKATLKKYMEEKGEKETNKTLIACRKMLWKVLSKYELKVEKLSPAHFLHFGTTKELLNIMTEQIDSYYYLDWERNIASFVDKKKKITAVNSIIKNSSYENNCYVENSIVENSKLGSNIVLSNTVVKNKTIPDNVALSTILLKSGKYTTRIYDITTDPKEIITKKTKMFEHSLLDTLECESISIWECPLYPICNTIEESVTASLSLYNIITKKATEEEIKKYNKYKKIDLQTSFNEADTKTMIDMLAELEENIILQKIESILEEKKNLKDAYSLYLNSTNKTSLENKIGKINSNNESTEIRKNYLLAMIDTKHSQKYMDLSFKGIEKLVSINHTSKKEIENYRKNKVTIESPVRINFGGGWSDTPPYCIEHGGCVLNIAIKLNKVYPISVTVEKTKSKKLIFGCEDFNDTSVISTIEDVRNCKNPNDFYALLKCAMMISEMIKDNDTSLKDLFNRIGGGLKITTNTKMIPRGSGLGTSSILSGTVLKALYEFMGISKKEEEICDDVLRLEQLMSTGGGWQDQVGGLIKGLKLIKTNSGNQILNIKQIKLKKKTIKELNSRILLINTAQRRLARNLLRDVIGKYISGNEETIKVLSDIQKMAIKMAETLEKGNLNEFANQLNKHWELSQKLDSGCTNTCIDFIFDTLNDLIDGKFICGAGGGGFLVILLKENVTKEQVDKRIQDIFQGTGVEALNIEIDEL